MIGISRLSVGCGEWEDGDRWFWSCGGVVTRGRSRSPAPTSTNTRQAVSTARSKINLDPANHTLHPLTWTVLQWGGRNGGRNPFLSEPEIQSPCLVVDIVDRGIAGVAVKKIRNPNPTRARAAFGTPGAKHSRGSVRMPCGSCFFPSFAFSFLPCPCPGPSGISYTHATQNDRIKPRY
jgi:hypothetical protein